MKIEVSRAIRSSDHIYLTVNVHGTDKIEDAVKAVEFVDGEGEALSMEMDRLREQVADWKEKCIYAQEETGDLGAEYERISKANKELRKELNDIGNGIHELTKKLNATPYTPSWFHCNSDWLFFGRPPKSCAECPELRGETP